MAEPEADGGPAQGPGGPGSPGAPGDPDRAPAYQVVARRFRPATFDQVVGQEAIHASLRAALQSQRIPHAFLFSGSRGVGKTTTARILARCLNCERGPTPSPCGTCALCRSILEGSNPDVIEIDAASNRGIDDIRYLIERVATASMLSRYKVYILDEVHMLTTQAFNALLKTLEEPPRGVAFVLATTELHKVPETIRSRCQVLQFRRIGDADIERRLGMIAAAEGVRLGEGVLADIAASCRGGMRDAETALERVLQVARAEGGTLDLDGYRELVQRIGIDRAVEVAARLAEGDAAAGLRFCQELQDGGVDEREALGELVEALRMAMLLQVDGPESGLVPHTGTVRERLQQLAAGTERQRLTAMVQAGLLGRERIRRLEDRAAVLELTIVRMAEAGLLPSLGELLAAVRDGGGAAAVAGALAGTAAPAAAAPSKGTAPAGDLRARVLALTGDQQLLRATLELCRFEGPDADGRVVVTLDSDRRMHQDRLQAPGLQQQVQQFVQSAAGRPVEVRFRVAGGGTGETPAPRPAAADVPPGQAARRVMQRFGGRVVAVDPDGQRERTQPGEEEGADPGVLPDEPPARDETPDGPHAP